MRPIVGPWNLPRTSLRGCEVFVVGVCRVGGWVLSEQSELIHRGTSPIRKHQPPRTTIGPYAQAHCRVLGWGCFL